MRHRDENILMTSYGKTNKKERNKTRENVSDSSRIQGQESESEKHCKWKMFPLWQEWTLEAQLPSVPGNSEKGQ
jgi:hypothetical protein